MTDGGRSVRSYHSPVPQRHSPHSGPPSHQSSPQRQVRFGDQQEYLQPEVDQDEDEEMEPEQADDDLVGEIGIEDVTELRVKVVMAISAMRGKVGMCLYTQSENRLHFIEDQQDSQNWDLVQLILDQTKPDKIYTSSGADVPFTEVLDQEMTRLHPDSNFAVNGTLVEHVSKKEFLSGKGRQMLQNVEIREGGVYESSWSREGSQQIDQLGDAEVDEASSSTERAAKRVRRGAGPARASGNATLIGDQQRRNANLRIEAFLASIESSSITLGCAGVLLANLSGLLRTPYDHQHRDKLSLSGLQLLRLDRVMQIGSDALHSLDIFAEEEHASLHQNVTREGASLFGMMNLAKTRAGQVQLRQWFLRPTLELDIINQRQDAIECLLNQENAGPVGQIRSELRQVRNPNRLIRIISQYNASYKDWKSIASFALAAVKIVEAAKNLVGLGQSELRDKINKIDIESIKEVGDNIIGVVDFAESAARKGGRVVVRAGVSEQLDESKRREAGLGPMLNKLAEAVTEQIPSTFAETLKIMYIPQVGYLFQVPTKPGMEDTAKNWGMDGWVWSFEDDQCTYFKTDQCRDLDGNIGDLTTIIIDREVEIVHILSSEVTAREEVIKQAAEVIADLDCLVALMLTARANHWCRPRMVEEPVLKIKHGRHPLVERLIDNYIANSTILIGGQGVGVESSEPSSSDVKAEGGERKPGMRTDSVMIVTGANYSGKSVHLKSVALITYLAHVGSFVPAEKAIVGLTDRILTRLSTRESISRASSAFMLDLQQVSFVLRNVTEHSLVVLDELGKGTEAHDGAGVFCGVINHLVQRGAQTPRTIASTHFQTVFRRGLLSSQLPINVVHMKVLIPDNLNASDNTASNESTYRHSASTSTEISYLYELRPGLAQGSQAGACARLFGIDEDVVQEATKVSNFLSRFELEGFLPDAEDEAEGTREEFEEGERVARRMLLWEPRGWGTTAEALMEVRAILGEADSSAEWEGVLG